MPHMPVWEGNRFNLNDEEDLYAEQDERDGKFAERG